MSGPSCWFVGPADIPDDSGELFRRIATGVTDDGDGTGTRFVPVFSSREAAERMAGSLPVPSRLVRCDGETEHVSFLEGLQGAGHAYVALNPSAAAVAVVPIADVVSRARSRNAT